MSPTSPFEKLATWLWDRTGERRRAQAIRVFRTRRKIRQHDVSHQRAVQQIRRTQEVAASLGEGYRA